MISMINMANGATVLAADVRMTAAGGVKAGEGTVLAQHPGIPGEYVTWFVWRDAATGDRWEASNGHYVGDSYAAAVADYDARRGVVAVPF